STRQSWWLPPRAARPWPRAPRAPGRRRWHRRCRAGARFPTPGRPAPGLGFAPAFVAGRTYRESASASCVRRESSEYPLAQSDRDRTDPVVHVELAEDGTHVGLHRLFADHELAGDGAVGEPSHQIAQDLALALCEAEMRARP